MGLDQGARLRDSGRAGYELEDPGAPLGGEA